MRAKNPVQVLWRWSFLVKPGGETWAKGWIGTKLWCLCTTPRGYVHNVTCGPGALCVQRFSKQWIYAIKLEMQHSPVASAAGVCGRQAGCAGAGLARRLWCWAPAQTATRPRLLPAGMVLLPRAPARSRGRSQIPVPPSTSTIKWEGKGRIAPGRAPHPGAAGGQQPPSGSRAAASPAASLRLSPPYPALLGCGGAPRPQWVQEKQTHCAFSLERLRGFFSVEGDASGGRSTRWF